MSEYERYKIALAKAKEVEKMNLPEHKKEEIYHNLGNWIYSEEEDLPFPFGKKPRKI